MLHRKGWRVTRPDAGAGAIPCLPRREFRTPSQVFHFIRNGRHPVKPPPPISGDGPDKAWPESVLDGAAKMAQARAGIDLKKTRAEFNPDECRRWLAQDRLLEKEAILEKEAVLRGKRVKFDIQAGDLVIALRAGRLDEQFQRTGATNDCDLMVLGLLADAVRHRRTKILRKFFDAVGRFHARSSGDGPTFRVAPAGKPKMRRALEVMVLAEEPLISGNDFAKCAADLGSLQCSERHERRIARQVGAKPGKAGRPPKPKLGNSHTFRSLPPPTQGPPSPHETAPAKIRG